MCLHCIVNSAEMKQLPRNTTISVSGCGLLRIHEAHLVLSRDNRRIGHLEEQRQYLQAGDSSGLRNFQYLESGEKIPCFVYVEIGMISTQSRPLSSDRLVNS
jgi:hypothetical protein